MLPPLPRGCREGGCSWSLESSPGHSASTDRTAYALHFDNMNIFVEIISLFQGHCVVLLVLKAFASSDWVFSFAMKCVLYHGVSPLA